jgi:hypothetical protein
MSTKPIKVRTWYEYIHKHPGFIGCIVDKYSDVAWYKNGEIHRENAPAIECANGTKSWFLNGKRHRTDGPAVEYANGSKEWYLNGIPYIEQEHRIAVRQMKLKLLDTDQRTL